MTSVALFIKHKTLPGERDEVRAAWGKHLAPIISANRWHEAYFYCFDNSDPDCVCAFQVYQDSEASSAFLKTNEFANNYKDVEPLLAGPPDISTLTPVWVK